MGKKVLRDWEDPYIIKHNKEDGRAVLHSFSTAEASTAAQNLPWKKTLNGTWKFNWAKKVSERPEDFYKPEYSVSQWDDIDVPSVWQLKGYDQLYYIANGYPPPISTKKSKIPTIDAERNPVGSYRRTFTVPAKWLSRQIFIHFGAVKAAFYLWINGQKVGYSQGSMTPAEFNITEFIQKGENTVAVEVYRYSDGTYLECQDMWYLSGIYREVFLFAEPDTFVRDFFAHSSLDKAYKDAEITVEATIKNYKEKPVDVVLETYLWDGKAELPGTLIEERPLTIEKGEERTVNTSGPVTNPKKWTAETPNLYTVIVQLKSKGKKII